MGTSTGNFESCSFLENLLVTDMLALECRQRLRLCICCSPSDPRTQILLRRFPALTSCCAVNVLRAWSADALHSVAEQKLEPIKSALQQQNWLLHPASPLPNVNDRDLPEDHIPSVEWLDQKMERLCRACADMFEVTIDFADRYRKEQKRFFYVTPSSYLRFLDGVCQMYLRQAAQQQQQQHQYELGLLKLNEMSSQVIKMQQQLERLQPELIKASLETQQLMQTITAKQEQASRTMVSFQKAFCCNRWPMQSPPAFPHVYFELYKEVR